MPACGRGASLDGWEGEKSEPGTLKNGARALKEVADNGLLSHPISGAVPSALRGLTTVFGMGTGVAPAR
jgi:hypothetical protein